MDCLSETETDVEKKTFLPSGNLENITQAKKIIPITEGGSCRSQMKSLLGNKRIFEVKSPEFSPLKHYLNSLYGFSDIDPDAKIVCIIEPVSLIITVIIVSYKISFTKSFIIYLR